MGNPLYRVRSSGANGSGYGIPPLPDQAFKQIKNADGNMIDVAVDESGKPVIVIGITTVLKQGNQDGIAHWAAQQTAAYAVTHIDSLLSRTEEAGYGFLQYHWKREPDWESDDLLTAYDRVLHDSAELGTAVHDYLEWRLSGEQGFAPELNKPEFRQMAEQVDLWLFENRVEVHAIEETWWGDHYAGTLDLVATVNGVPYLLDAKGLPLDTPIPTPEGWSTMEELTEGDMVFGADGNPYPVTLKSEIHHKPCLKITFDTGESAICDEDHRWAVRTGGSARGYKDEVLTAREMVDRGIFGNSGQRDLRIMNPKPLSLPDAELPLDPYVLGVWLGDGTASKNEITINDGEKHGIMEEIENRGWPVRIIEYPSDRESHGVRIGLGDAGYFGKNGGSEFKNVLKGMGVINNKHIPQGYMRASFSQRLDLMRGLMDTDGSVNKARGNECAVITTDLHFRDQVAELASSLGLRTYTYETQVSWTHKGEKKWTTAHGLRFRMLDFNVFLRRNQDAFKPVAEMAMARRRIIVSIDEIDMVPTQCIEVGSPDHTYLFGRSMIPTHNTSRNVQSSHKRQLAALHHADSPYKMDEEGNWYVADKPHYEKFGFLHVRPDDWDSKGNLIPAFCRLEVVDEAELEVHWKAFQGLLQVARSEQELKKLAKTGK